MYQKVCSVQGAIGDSPTLIGKKGVCRYCNCSDPNKFRKRAHTFPEALGNKWILSNDECDDCNHKFAVYEDALTKAVGPFLTLGGTKGKRGVRQTGRSKSNTFLRHSVENGRRRLSVLAEGDFLDIVNINPLTGCFRLNIPICGDRFVPRLAFKSLCKGAVGLLPPAELPHARDLLIWMAEPEGEPAFQNLRVGLSFASVGNAPPVVVGSLYRRVNDADPVPYLIYVFVAGSVCLQIQVPVGRLDLHVPSTWRPCVQWTNQFATPDGGWEVMKYSAPIQLDWNSPEATLQPIKSLQLDFNPTSQSGNLKPILRDNL